MWMIHFPGVSAKGSAKPSPGTVRKDGEGLSGNITSLLWSDPAEQQKCYTLTAEGTEKQMTSGTSSASGHTRHTLAYV